nr:MAG TPA: hypothetical protein [Bacteriophage sp.]
MSCRSLQLLNLERIKYRLSRSVCSESLLHHQLFELHDSFSHIVLLDVHGQTPRL